MKSLGCDMAPQVGLEPTTLRLTAEAVVAALRYRHKAYGHAMPIIVEFRGDSRGTRHASPGAVSRKAVFRPQPGLKGPTSGLPTIRFGGGSAGAAALHATGHFR